MFGAAFRSRSGPPDVVVGGGVVVERVGNMLIHEAIS
jgi:hypothetical protein